MDFARPSKPIDEAIKSIPAYVASCELFLVLCPMVHDLNQQKTFGQVTWASRGWRRMAKTLRQFSDQQSAYIVIKSAQCFEAVATPVASVIDGCPGDGRFGFNEDRRALGMILKAFLKQKIRNHLRCADLASYCTFLNLTHWFLRGFASECQASSMSDMAGWECSLSEASSVEEFLGQNGFSSINEVDKAGRSPICYAALNGNPHLIEGLLDLRANVASTVQAHPCIGNAPYISILSLSAYFSQNEAVQVLLASKANPEEGSFNALRSALSGNNPAMSIRVQFGETLSDRLVSF
eukprot:Skav211280  [mRNA]  locus=scaffold2429:106300:107181:+ [translate_table: standard]